MSCISSFGHNPTVKQLNICQGSSLSLRLTFTNSAGTALNLTGYTFRGQIRPEALSATITESFNFDTALASTGIIDVSLTATETAAITAGESKKDTSSLYWYDMEYVQPGGDVIRFIEGPCVINRNVTR